MRRCIATFALVGLVAALVACQQALAQDPVDNTRRSMGNLRPTPPATGQQARAQNAVNNTRRSMGNLRPGAPTTQGTTQGSNRPVVVVPYPYYGRYGYPYYRGYGPYYPGSYGYYPYYYPPYPYYRGPVVYPPIYIPAETIYGSGALNRFMRGW